MQEYKIVVQGTRKIISYLKDYIKIPNKIFYFSKQNEKYFNKLKRADVVITMSWGKTMWGGTDNLDIPKVENLKLIHLPGAGIDAINFSKIPKNCQVCNVYEHEIPIAEYCLGTILNWEMNLITKLTKFKNLDWSDCMIFDGPTHSELFNKTIGILGYGKIGKAIAKRIKPFGTKLIGYTRNSLTKDKYLDHVYLSEGLKKNVSQLDYLIVACPLNKNTKNLVNSSILNAMKHSSVIVNIARGGIINEKDLYNALKEKKIGGAIIDTWFKYPTNKDQNGFNPSKFNFNKMKNVIMSPHISAWSEEMIKRRSSIISENINRLYSKKKLMNKVNP
jgi:lactate dehydrogenase-like 2-hydroxyacid dehydrogenase